MVFKCLKCGNTFKKCRKIFEPHGESVYICPHCGESQEIVSAVPCAVCGEEYADKDYGVCNGCIGNIDTLIAFGEQGGLNYFLNSVYSDEVINSLLKQDLSETLSAEGGKFKTEILEGIGRFISENRAEISDYLIKQSRRSGYAL